MCMRLLQLTHETLCEIIGRLDLSAPHRLDMWKLRNIIERFLISEGRLP